MDKSEKSVFSRAGKTPSRSTSELPSEMTMMREPPKSELMSENPISTIPSNSRKTPGVSDTMMPIREPSKTRDVETPAPTPATTGKAKGDPSKTSAGKENQETVVERLGLNSCALGICGTNMIVSKYDREKFIRVTLVEFTIYLGFLVIVCMITYGMTTSYAYYYTNIISRLFVDTPFEPGDPTTFRTSATIEDFWKFSETAMLGGLYWKYWYGVQDINNLIPDKHKGILYEHRLIGRARLRQIRVMVEPCPVSENFNRLLRECYPPYSYKMEEKKPYNFILQNLPAWKYHTEAELNETWHWGRLATYSGAGAYQLLGTDRDESIQFLTELKNNLWVTRATRVIFLDFTLHNANLNLFCIAKLVWELPPTGGLITSWSIRTVRLLKYSNAFDYFLFVLEILFCVYTVWYTIQEILEMCVLPLGSYFGSVWAYIDILCLLISYCCIAYTGYREYVIRNELPELLNNPGLSANHVPFHLLGFLEAQYMNAIAVLVFLSWIRLFKYISFNRTMTQLSTTMSRCAKDIGGFAIMFFIVFFAFAQLGYLLFGSQVDEFRSFHDTVFSLLRLILGDFDFRAIEIANRVLGPIFFVSYVFFVFFVLLNMFLAIINDTYSQVKAEDKRLGPRYQVTDYLWRLCSRCRKRDKKAEAESQMRLANSENIIKTEELRENLKKSKYSDVEIEMFLTRYELDENRPIELDEAEYVLGNLEGFHDDEKNPDSKEKRKSTDGDANAKALTDEEISELQSRVGVLESLLTGVTRKIDDLTHKMEAVDTGPKSAQRLPLL